MLLPEHSLQIGKLTSASRCRRIRPVEAFSRSEEETAEVTLYDAHTNARIADLPGHLRRVYSMAFSPDGSRLVTGSMDQTVNVYNVSKRVLERTFREHRATIGGIAFHPDGDRIATAAGDNQLLLWSLSTGRVLGEFRGHLTDVSALASTPDGSRLVSGDWSGVVKSWEWSTEDVRTLRVTSGWIVPEVYEVAWDSRQETLVCATNGGALNVWNLSGEHIRGIDATTPTRCVAYSPDGSFLASANDSGDIILHNSTGAKALLTAPVHRGPIISMTIHPTGKMLVTASADSSVILSGLPNVERIGQLVGHQGVVNDVEFSPNGHQLASGGEDGTIRFWDPASGESTGVVAGRRGRAGHRVRSERGSARVSLGVRGDSDLGRRSLTNDSFRRRSSGETVCGRME